MHHTRTQRLAIAVTRRLPRMLVVETERVVLNVGIAVVGITSLLALHEPGSIATVLPIWLLIQWSGTLILGGGLTLVGMWRSMRLVERAGLILKLVGCATYAGALFRLGTPRAGVVACLFLAITAAALIRLLVSTATNATVINGSEEDQ